MSSYSDIECKRRIVTDGGTPQWQPTRQKRRSVSHWILLGFLLSVFATFGALLLLASMGAGV